MSTPRAALSEAEVGDWADELEGQRIETILERAWLRFGERLVMTSNFGAEGVVVLDHLRRIAPGTPIIYLDTGFQFSETDRVKEEIRTRFGLNIVEYRSELSVVEQGVAYGERLYDRDPGLCCQMRKVDPLARALAGYDAWIAALRRDQSPTRALIRVVEWNATHGMVKINPLATWTRKEVWEYIVRYGLPYNRLYDDGYTSIGCQPCTRRVGAGDHERS
ncbi:MAG: phosphoadenylyl-sulfate reductase, partial [Acidobacteriota bacterium]